MDKEEKYRTSFLSETLNDIKKNFIPCIFDRFFRFFFFFFEYKIPPASQEFHRSANDKVKRDVDGVSINTMITKWSE